MRNQVASIHQEHGKNLYPWAFVGIVLFVLVTLAALIPLMSGVRIEDIGLSVEGLVYVAAAMLAFCFLVARRHLSTGVLGWFWTLISFGVLLRFVGHLGSWSLYFAEPGMVAFTLLSVSYGASYVVFAGALVWLVSRTTTRATLLSVLDSAAAVFSVGLLTWFFTLSPVLDLVADGRIALVAFLRLLGDVALLCLSLVILSNTRRPPFTMPLCIAFLAMLAADATCILRFPLQALPLQANGLPGTLDLPVLGWSLGFVCLGVAAVRPGRPEGLARSVQSVPWRVLAFWLSPLSPAMHVSFLLLWTALYGRLFPEYVYLGAAAIVVYLAFRMGIIARTSGQVRLDRERLVACEERARLAEDLHDTLKQEVHSVPLMLELYREAEADGDRTAAGEILDKAIETSNNASYRVSRPVWELRARSGTTVDALLLLRQVIRDINRSLPVDAREDLRAPLDTLSPEELAATYRITSEALWNAAKHSGAKNVTVVSRRDGGPSGPTLIVEVHDDGLGFRAGTEAEGLGIPLMRTRAEKAGAELEISSEPGEGTVVRLRFHGR